MEDKIAVNEKALDELLNHIYINCLVCPPPFDYNDVRYDDTRQCPDVTCAECWKSYLTE